MKNKELIRMVADKFFDKDRKKAAEILEYIDEMNEFKSFHEYFNKKL
jgi:fructose 1,6-bisphosphatase